MAVGRRGEGVFQRLKMRRRLRERSGVVQMTGRRGSISSMMTSLEGGGKW